MTLTQAPIPARRISILTASGTAAIRAGGRHASFRRLRMRPRRPERV